MKELSLYIHIPFCKSKCSYCDFISFPKSIYDEEYYEKYSNVLIDEIKEKGKYYKDRIVKTIFFGGGTPSILPVAFFESIVVEINNNFNVSDEIEFTVETNPETADLEKFKAYIKLGVNRISFGAQSFDEKILKRISRIHDSNQIYKAFSLARESGFKNISLDIMFGLPDQTMSSFMDTLDKAVDLKPEHISCYGLILEENSKLYNERNLNLPDEEEEREMYYKGKDFLKSRGYCQYEISNFSKEGYESKHNLVYWTNKEYVGFGISAASYIDKSRYRNTNSIDKYLDGDFDKRELHNLTKEDIYSEYMFLGLRKIKGVADKDFYSEFGVHIDDIFKEPMDTHIENGLLAYENGRLFLTDEGIYISNIVFGDFLL